MKHTKNILFLIITIIYVVVVSGFISSKEKTHRISNVKIRITDSTENQFIRQEDVRKIIEHKKFDFIGKDYRAVDLEAIEEALINRQIILKAEAYITEPGIVHIDISQKTPFVRIFNRYGQGYYLDKQGNIIPVSQSFSPFVLIANGYIAEPFKIGNTLNIMEAKHDSISRALHTVYDVFKLAAFITEDDFWNAQIEQIYVNGKYEIELIPRVGSHVIELGRVENLEDKFDNLKILYTRGFNNLGWNKYDKISLKYKNQVVCTKIQ
jgi:cell division protein FtsQ